LLRDPATFLPDFQIWTRIENGQMPRQINANKKRRLHLYLFVHPSNGISTNRQVYGYLLIIFTIRVKSRGNKYLFVIVHARLFACSMELMTNPARHRKLTNALLYVSKYAQA
jgi:hypothetical protein